MTTPHLFPRLLGAATLLVAIASQTTGAFAGTSGGIAGIVTNSQTGTPVAGAKVRISSPSQTVTTTTDAKGHYIVFALQPDSYTLTAVKQGYDVGSFRDYEVQADQTQQVDMKLTPSSDADAAAPPPGR